MVWAHSISEICSHLFEVQGRNTRSAANFDLYVPSGRHTEVCRQRLGYRGAIAWTNLDPRIKEYSTVNTFKCMYVRKAQINPILLCIYEYSTILLIFY